MGTTFTAPRLAIAVCTLLQAAIAGNDTAWKDLLAQGDALLRQGRYQDAREISARALREAERIDREGPQVAITLNQIGLLHGFSGDFARAERAYLRGLRILDACGCETLRLSELLDNLSSLYLNSGTHAARSEQLRRRALDLGLSKLGPDHPDIGILLTNLAATVMVRRAYTEAETLYERALTLLEPHADRYAVNIGALLANRAVLLFHLGRLPDALSNLGRAIEIHEQALGKDHPDLAWLFLNTARIHLKLDRAALAEDPIRRAIAAAGRFGPEHPILAEALFTQAVVLRKTGRKLEARETEKHARAIRAASPPRVAGLTVHVSDLVPR